MKAIVTGATGFLGQHLVAMLVERGNTVIALGRNEEKGRALSSENVAFKKSDITDLVQLSESFESADVVFHCAALSSAWGKYERFFQVNVEGTRNVLLCCEKFNIRRLVYVSSTSVYFGFEDKVDIKEDQVLTKNFANYYAKTKYLAERLILADKKTTEAVVIRPRGIVGDGDTSIMPRILRVADRGFFPLINNGSAVVDICYVKNVCHALCLAAEKPDLDAKCINISNLEPISVKELLRKVFDRRKSRVRLIPVNYHLIYSLAAAFEAWSRLFNLSEPSITRCGVGLLSKSQTLNTQAASDLLDYKPLYSIDHAIEEFVKWESSNA